MLLFLFLFFLLFLKNQEYFNDITELLLCVEDARNHDGSDDGDCASEGPFKRLPSIIIPNSFRSLRELLPSACLKFRQIYALQPRNRNTRASARRVFRVEKRQNADGLKHAGIYLNVESIMC